MTCRLQRALLVVLCVVAATVGVPGAPAGADEFGFPSPPAPGFFGDGRDYYFYFDPSVPSVDRQRYRDAMEFLDDSTVLFDVPTSSLGPGTDIVFIHAAGPINGNPDVRGLAVCARQVNPLICDQFWVLVYLPAIFAQATGGQNFDVNFDKTIRHEIGHTTGLRHSNPAPPAGWTVQRYRAMRSGPVPTSLIYYAYEAADHLPHINGFY